jgi:hypothetical protein
MEPAIIHAELAKPTSADGLKITIYNCDEATFKKLTASLTERGNNGSHWVTFVGEITIFKA